MTEDLEQPADFPGVPGEYPSETWARWRQVVHALNARIARVHEEVRCPKCGAPVGVRCRSMPRGWRPLDVEGQYRELKSPHKWRITAAGIKLR